MFQLDSKVERLWQLHQELKVREGRSGLYKD